MVNICEDRLLVHFWLKFLKYTFIRLDYAFYTHSFPALQTQAEDFF